MAFFVLGPVALLASLIASFFAFGWWGIVAAAISVFLYVAFYGLSSRGNAGPYAISILLCLALGVHVFDVFSVPAIARFAVLLVFALWCARMLYVGSTIFYRAMALRGAKIFDFLSDGIELRRAD